jgi:hypothetical protein
MTVLTIRKYQRFAVRQMASVHLSRRKPLSGLLVEVSLEGCRLGNVRSDFFAVGQKCKVRIDGFGDRLLEVRWAQHGSAGLRFVQALHIAELDGLLRLCRATDECDLRAYGT